MKNLFVNAVGIAKEICKAKIEESDIVVDATMGNGNDTAFLCDLVGERGKVYAFDIQENAIENTRQRLDGLKLEERAILIHDGHENMDKYINGKVKLVIFNLGYLPRGNHKITTKKESTLQAIEKSLDLLMDGGMVVLVIYPGHENGKDEKLAIEDFTKDLEQGHFSVVNIQFKNQINDPPELVCIENKL